jgi:hypothetical protein
MTNWRQIPRETRLGIALLKQKFLNFCLSMQKVTPLRYLQIDATSLIIVKLWLRIEVASTGFFWM